MTIQRVLAVAMAGLSGKCAKSWKQSDKRDVKLHKDGVADSRVGRFAPLSSWCCYYVDEEMGCSVEAGTGELAQGRCQTSAERLRGSGHLEPTNQSRTMPNLLPSFVTTVHDQLTASSNFISSSIQSYRLRQPFSRFKLPSCMQCCRRSSPHRYDHAARRPADPPARECNKMTYCKLN